MFNPAQTEAMRHGGGPMMVLAGPGSGKTTVITHRVHFLIEDLHIDPEKILVITFTKSATEEMRRRFLEIASADDRPRVTFSTFHALFYRIIRARYFLETDQVLQENHRKDAVRRILAEMRLEHDDDMLLNILNEISWIKNDLIDIRFYHSMSLSTEDFQAVYQRYEDFKREQHKLDFDDMLVWCCELFRSEPDTLRRWQEVYHYILIDEFQDINQVQYKCITDLAEPRRNLFIVGDDDQSIYKFRGARPEFLLRFPQDYPETARTVLDTNYRSTEPIIALCNRVIERNKIRYSKVMAGTGRIGPKPAVLISEDANEEAMAVANKIKAIKTVPLHEIAVIYRVNMQARALVDAFMNMNIPYQVKDEMSSIYEHWIAKDIYAYLQLSLNPEANEAMARVVNRPARYINNAIVAAARQEDGSLLDNLRRSPQLQSRQRSRMEEMAAFLKVMAGQTPHEAIQYLRSVVAYNKYIQDYSVYRKMSSAGLYEVLEEIQEAAKAFSCAEDFMAHMLAAAAQAKENHSLKKRAVDPDEDTVLLSTMHSAKGLEFDTVFLIGAVEGRIPHEKSKTDSEIEEERRLLYVGLTRAKTNLLVSLVRGRHETAVKPTRFLNDILWKEPKNKKEPLAKAKKG